MGKEAKKRKQWLIPAQKHLVGGKEVYVFDDVLPKNEYNSFCKSLSHIPYQRVQFDDQSTGHKYNYYSAHIEQKDAVDLKISREIFCLVEEYFPSEKFKAYSTYINRNDYGDMTFPHRDYSEGSKAVSAVYYSNFEWKTEWGGETLFFDQKNQAQIAITPKPNRLIIFRGTIKHKIGVPTRQCIVSRLSFAVKFKSTR